MNILKWHSIAQDRNKKEFKLGLGGSGSSGSSSGSGTSSGSSWLLEDFGDELDGLIGGMLGNLGNMPSFSGADYDTAMGGLGKVGSYYKDMMTTDSSQQMSDVLKAQSDMAQANLDSSLAGIGESANMAGGAGGSRHGIAQGVATAQANQDLNALQSQTAAEFMAADRQAKLAGAQGLASTIGAGLSISKDQARSEYIANLQQSNPELYQLLVAQGALGGMAGWGGSSSSDWSSSSDSGSSGWGLSLCDKNFKENITKIGQLSNGINLYIFSYTQEAQEKLAMPSGAQVGVIAQEVLEVLPEAVQEFSEGFYVVDYHEIISEAVKGGESCGE